MTIRVGQFVVVTLMFCCSVRFGFAETVDFSRDGTLRAVFDSGLRPWMYKTGIDECNVSHVGVTVLLPDGHEFSDFPVDYGSFRVLRDFSIGSADFSTGLIGLAEAVTLAERMATELGVSPTGVKELALRAVPGRVFSDQWSREAQLGEVSVFVRFYPVARQSDVKGAVEINLRWKREPKRALFWTTKMSPPPGYEDVGFGASPEPAKGAQAPEH